MAGMVKRADFLENEVVDLTEEIKLVSPTDTPLTTLLMGRGQVVPANDITVTWREKELNSDRGTLKLEGAEAGDVITSSRKTLSNVCQIIEKVTQVSGTARSLNPNGFLIAILGGRWHYGSTCGFSLIGYNASGGRYRGIGGRLLYVPQTKVA